MICIEKGFEYGAGVDVKYGNDNVDAFCGLCVKKAKNIRYFLHKDRGYVHTFFGKRCLFCIHNDTIYTRYHVTSILSPKIPI